MSYRICFVTHASMDRHATIKRAFGMAPPLVQMGHTVDICAEDNGPNREIIAALPGVNPLWFQPGSLRAERSQKSAIVGGKFDVIHLCGLGFRNAVVTTANPAALTIMDHVELESSIASSPRSRRSAQYALEWFSLFHYRAHVLASSYLKNLWQERCKTASLRRHLLYMPFAFDSQWRLRLAQASGETVRNRFPGKKVLFYMGAFQRAYGFYQMLDAIERLHRKRNDIAAVLCGRGPELQPAIRMLNQKGLSQVIVTPGFVPESELLSYLAAADVLISPLQDTIADRARCPSKLYEYMTTNRPIVTCKLGENANALGDRGHYYQPDNAASMVDALERALSSGEPKYGLDQHSWTARARTYSNWLDTIPQRGAVE